MAKRKTISSQNAPLQVLKTYKMYIGGQFPRTESGRYYNPENADRSLGNICMASRKDVRNAIVAARSAQTGWASRSAYNRGQILYRIAEMLEDRREQFISELQKQGLSAVDASDEVQESIDRLIVYAGWADKFQQIFSTVNPVSSSHFNFSILEPTGVVFAIANETSPLLGLVSIIAPIICGGNSVVVLASESKPLSAITFAEVLNSSDVPGGVVNILTGKLIELAEHFSRHLDVNAIAYDRDDDGQRTAIQEWASGNVKRVMVLNCDWKSKESANPYLIEKFCEVKTTWHPIEKISASGSGY